MQAALSDVGGAAQMFVTQNMYTSSLMKPIAMDIEPRSVIDVVVTTIDQYMDKQHLRSFDFIKLDLQLNELKALKGAATALKTCKASLVQGNFTERSEEHTSALKSIIRISYA